MLVISHKFLWRADPERVGWVQDCAMLQAINLCVWVTGQKWCGMGQGLLSFRVSMQINSSIALHPSKFSTNTANISNVWLTGIVSQVLLMNCSLSVDWLYVMLQLLRTPGTTYGIQKYDCTEVANESGVARILIMS